MDIKTDSQDLIVNICLIFRIILKLEQRLPLILQLIQWNIEGMSTFQLLFLEIE